MSSNVISTEFHFSICSSYNRHRSLIQYYLGGMENTISLSTCGWSVSPANWTWCLLGSAAGQRCSSLSLYASFLGPLLLRHNFSSIHSDAWTCTHALNTQHSSIFKKCWGRLTERFIGCLWTSQKGNKMVTNRHGSKLFADSCEPMLQTACQAAWHALLSLYHSFNFLSSRLKQKYRGMTPQNLSVSSGLLWLEKHPLTLSCQVRWKNPCSLHPHQRGDCR